MTREFKLPAEQEFRNRVEKVRKAMVSKDLDALVVYADEHRIHGGNCHYLSGYRSTIRYYYELVIPRDGEITMIIQPGINRSDINLSTKVCWIKDIRTVGVAGATVDPGYNIDRMNIVDYAGATKTLLSERGLATGRIGISSMDSMSHRLLQSFRSALPDATLIDGAGIVEAARKVKSPWEIEVLREAHRLSDLSLDAFLEIATPGMRQEEAISCANYATVKAGAEAAFSIMGAGFDPFVWGSLRGELRFIENDIIPAEFNAMYGAYYGQVCRTRFLGKPTDAQVRAYHAVNEAENAMASLLRPGAVMRDLWHKGNEVLGTYGLKFFVEGRPGHGIGLTIAENFNVGANETDVLEPDCVILIHPSVPLNPGKIMLGNAYRITATGSERITHAKYWL